METQKVKGGNTYIKEGRFEHEKNDCVIIALSYTFDLTYAIAHSLCKKAGRIDGKGMVVSKIFDGLKVNDFRQFSFQSCDRRVVTRKPRPFMTVGKFAKVYSQGIYLVTCGGHAFSVIEGQILNQTNMNCVVDEFYKITLTK